MRTTCPNCGAPIEFRYDDSFVRVCASCNHAVLRTDRSVESLGKVADLVPIESPLKLFAEGHEGSISFLLVGMAQIRHEAGGLWQEWYAKLDGGQWGWLAEAQGRYYLTFEVPWLAAPNDVAVGQRIDIPVRGATRTMTVGEVTSAAYVGARGELPFKLVPNETFRYADLSDGQGTFATIDFGDTETPPKLYVGQQVNVADLHLTGGEVGPPAGDQITSQRLACPVCNGPIELRAPGESLRAVCGYCNTLLDTSSGSALGILGKLANKAQPRIPLGTVGTFSEGKLTTIGFVQRSALVEGDWWPFDEYLLYAPGVGFRWLVESDGHWSYVQPIATGAVEASPKGVRYDGVSFAHYQQSQLRVDQVFGEFYWQVQEGETVEGDDFIAPPAMISRETSSTEANDSLSTYMTVREVERAFADDPKAAQLQIGSPTGIAPNQPDAWRAASAVVAFAFMALIVLGLVFAMGARNDQKFFKTVSLGGGPGPSTTATPLGTSALGTGLADPDSVPECVEFKKVYDASLACDKLVAAQHDAYKAVYDATFIASDKDILAAGCKTSTDMMHQSLDSQCKLPTHEELAAGSGSGSGSGTGSGTGSDAEVTTAPPDSVFFSEPIQIDGGRNVQLAFEASSLSNDWVYIAADLVHETTGAVTTGEANMEFYSGVDDGDSWSEGTRESKTVFGPQPEGKYVLRLEAQHGSAGLMPITVTLKQGVFRGRWLAWAMLVLGVPLFFVGLISHFHEKKRWENSNVGKAPVTPVALMILAFVGVFIAIGYILKALAESSSGSSD